MYRVTKFSNKPHKILSGLFAGLIVGICSTLLFTHIQQQKKQHSIVENSYYSKTILEETPLINNKISEKTSWISEIPQEIKNKYRIIKRFGNGGSSAVVLLVKDQKNREVVLKFSTWDGIGSAGIPALKAQAARLKELKKTLPDVGASRIPEVYEQAEGKKLFYYTMQYIKGGVQLAIYHIKHPEGGAQAFIKDLNNLLTLMSEQFYSQGKLKVPRGYIDRAYISRLNYRLSLMLKKEGDIYNKLIKGKLFLLADGSNKHLETIFTEIWNLREIKINGISYTNAKELLFRLKKDSVLLQQIQPGFLPKFAHGDGLLRNYMRMADGRLMIFDVRGTKLPNNTPARIDIAYELGKILYSIMAEVIQNNLFSLKILRQKDGSMAFQLNYDLKNQAVLNFLEVREKLPKLFQEHVALNQILKTEPQWIKRALFAEATHFLTDTVNRIEGDPTGRHSVAYYLVGIMLLNQAINNFQYDGA